MFYPQEVAEEVLRASDIVDVISGYVRLQKKGASFFGLCPFHPEKSPSFSVSPSKQMYYCFGCGAGGNVFSFLMNYEHFTFPEAVKALGERAGVKLPEAEASPEARKAADKRAVLLEIQKEAAKYFYYGLRSKQGEAGRQYLRRRGLTEETLQKFGLGFAAKSGGGLVSYLHAKGYRDEQLIQAGLAAADERYGIREKFWNRVIFPIMDAGHRVIGFGGRVMGEGLPKYLNSPETAIFDKSRNLYGLNFARTFRAENMILCEGYMDVASLHQAGFGQAVASLGTAFTVGQANLIRRYTDKVFLAYDSDGAGVNAALRALGLLGEAGLYGRVIDLSPCKDPDELISRLGRDEFAKRLEEAENGFLFEIRILKRDYDLKDPEGKSRFYQEIAARLCRFPEEMKRGNYLEAVADRYEISRESLRKMVDRHAAEHTGGPPRPAPRPGSRKANRMEDGAKRAQRLLLTWLVETPGLYSRVKAYLSEADFTEDFYRQMAARLFEGLDTEGFDPAFLLGGLTGEEELGKAAELFHTRLELPKRKAEREKAFHDILLTVKRNSLEYYSGRPGTDTHAIEQVFNAKKALEELNKTHISLPE